MLAERRPAVDVITSARGPSRRGTGDSRVGPPRGVRRCLRDQGLPSGRRHRRSRRCDASLRPHHGPQRARCGGAGRCSQKFKLVRPMWTRTSRDRWLEVDDAPDAARELACLAPPAALITLGSRSLAPFRRLEGMRLVFRMIAKPAEPIDIPGAGILLERGPFDLDHERALMTDRGIGALVTKASGGEATQAKIEGGPRTRPAGCDDPPSPAAGRPRLRRRPDDVVAWLDKERFI